MFSCDLKYLFVSKFSIGMGSFERNDIDCASKSFRAGDLVPGKMDKGNHFSQYTSNVKPNRAYAIFSFKSLPVHSHTKEFSTDKIGVSS